MHKSRTKPTRLPIRIIIPVLSSSDSLFKSLESLSDYPHQKHVSIVIVDNGLNPNLKQSLSALPVTIIADDSFQSAAYARNKGAENFKNGILVFLDQDVLCPSINIQQLIGPIERGLSDASVGNYSTDIDGLSFAQGYKQLYVHRVYSRKSGVIENEFWTAIGAIRAEVFHKLGGFNTSFFGACGEDTEFGMRLTKAGYKIIAVPEAEGKHLHQFTLTGIIRNDIRKGMSTIQNILRHKKPIFENRHSTPRDVLSVFFSTTLLLLVLFASYFNHNPLLKITSIICAAGWMICRRDILANLFRLRKISFCYYSYLLMYFLDLIRALCFLMALLKIKSASVRVSTIKIKNDRDADTSVLTPLVQVEC